MSGIFNGGKMALSVVDLYAKILPRTNCRDCGFLTCIAFTGMDFHGSIISKDIASQRLNSIILMDANILFAFFSMPGNCPAPDSRSRARFFICKIFSFISIRLSNGIGCWVFINLSMAGLYYLLFIFSLDP
ncbi:MAG: hypothetical protein B6230_01305 [Desulfobacteraceae bacterium 4572_89]|nr:MAG: hypothetical protein B6230_01305 [Desulfobacteraceae bacterium 4572_89]